MVIIKVTARPSTSGARPLMRTLLGLPTQTSCRSMAGIPKIKNLIPEDTPELKEWKERERRVVKEQMSRSKLSDARAAKTEKVSSRSSAGAPISRSSPPHAPLQLFVAPPDIVAALPENAFPDTAVTPVPGGPVASSTSVFSAAPATVVTLAFQGHGQAQLQPWLERIVTGLHAEPAFAAGERRPAALQHLNLLYLQGWFFKAFAPVIVHSTRRSIAAPALLQASAITFQPSQRDMDHWADKIRVTNRMQGHVFLVDRNGIVRWQAHGLPAPGELENLHAASQTLVAAANGTLRPPPGAFKV